MKAYVGFRTEIVIDEPSPCNFLAMTFTIAIHSLFEVLCRGVMYSTDLLQLKYLKPVGCHEHIVSLSMLMSSHVMFDLSSCFRVLYV